MSGLRCLLQSGTWFKWFCFTYFSKTIDPLPCTNIHRNSCRIEQEYNYNYSFFYISKLCLYCDCNDKISVLHYNVKIDFNHDLKTFLFHINENVFNDLNKKKRKKLKMLRAYVTFIMALLCYNILLRTPVYATRTIDWVIRRVNSWSIHSLHSWLNVEN